MKKAALFIALIASVLLVNAQPPKQMDRGDGTSNPTMVMDTNTLRLTVNPLGPEEAVRINSYIESRSHRLTFMGAIGIAALNTIITATSSLILDESVAGLQNLVTRKTRWERMIKNECTFVDSLSYINGLQDFYSKGSPNGALDPSDFNFNGFTLCAQRDGKDVLRFYCHVDTSEEGLSEIVDHSKFHLVLDSMYFYPYRCHLPNLMANQLCPERGKHYDRRTTFSFEDRDNLSVLLNFTITSSWYNQAIMLAKDVELGQFSIEVPIREDCLTDGVFIYKKDMEGMEPLTIAGDCFIVPRSYMPLTGGAPHWGTGEYNVKVVLTEHCSITKALRDDWKTDYHNLCQMKKQQKFWPRVLSYCVQNGFSILRCSLNSASSAAIGQWDWINQANIYTRGGGGASSGAAGSGKVPGGH